eukprot:1679091-Prymnesium_polylepis.1
MWFDAASPPPMGTASPQLPPALVNSSAADGASGASASYGVYLEAMLLALTSSTDNFAVGASLGIAGLRLLVRFNATIAAANACGAFLASEGGQILGHIATSAGPWIAGGVFAYLAFNEGASLANGEPASPLFKLAERGV